MAIPPKTSFYIETILSSISGDNILNGSCKNVSIMRQTSSKGRTIKKCISVSKEKKNVLTLIPHKRTKFYNPNISRYKKKKKGLYLCIVT